MGRWDDGLWLLTPEEFSEVPNGAVLSGINGKQYVKGRDYIDSDSRGGHIAFGFTLALAKQSHEIEQLFIVWKLKA